MDVDGTHHLQFGMCTYLCLFQMLASYNFKKACNSGLFLAHLSFSLEILVYDVCILTLNSDILSLPEKSIFKKSDN